MTKGSLQIIDAHGGRVYLYTHHTGMDIPQLVEKAVRVLRKLACFYIEADNVDQAYRTFQHGNQTERLNYASAIASLVIGACPTMLEPSTKAKWRDTGTRFTLLAGEEGWTLKKGSEVVLEFNPTERLAKLIVAETKRAKARNGKSVKVPA